MNMTTQALRLCEQEQDQQEHEHGAYTVCACHYYSIDGCMDINDDDNVGTEDNNDGTTIYQNPIFVYEGHNMASSLIHIISFNLAITHHLTDKTMATTNENENSNEPDKENFINKALQCYELAYECNLLITCSVRFDTIICNNLSHLYRSQEQTTEEQEQQETLQEQKEEYDEQPPPQRITSAAIDDEKSVELEELLELEYYSHEEEQEEYAHNRSLISLLTKKVSTTVSSSSATTRNTTTSTRNTIDRNEGFLCNVVSSSECSDCSKSSSLLLIKQEGGRGGDFCVITENDDSLWYLTYATCA